MKPDSEFTHQSGNALGSNVRPSIEQIVLLASPDLIYPFGPLARGDFEPDSDFDLLASCLIP